MEVDREGIRDDWCCNVKAQLSECKLNNMKQKQINGMYCLTTSYTETSKTSLAVTVAVVTVEVAA